MCDEKTLGMILSRNGDHSEDFTGHKMIILNDEYVLDLTEYKVYKVSVDSDSEEMRHELVLKIYRADRNGRYTIDKITGYKVPVDIVYRALTKIKMYEKGACLL